MLTEERLQKIVSYVTEKQSITVAQLTDLLDASEATIRRDLNFLHQEGLILKVRGGAIAKDTTLMTKDDTVSKRKEQNIEEKVKIARYAATLLEPNDFVYLDAGTTTEMMIDYLQERQVTFVTNAISHGKKLTEKGYTTYILGGELKLATEAIVGEIAIASLEQYHFTKGFWGANGIDDKQGITTPEMKEARLKKQGIRQCKTPYVLCDSSKFSKVSSVTFASFNEVNIITNKLNDKRYQQYKNIKEVK